MKKMDSPKGMFSYKKNPMKPAKKVQSKVGGGSFGGNADQMKVGKLMQKAYKESDSLRGKMGM